MEDVKEMTEQQCFSSLKSQKKQLLNFHKMLQQLFKFFVKYNNGNAKNCKFIRWCWQENGMLSMIKIIDYGEGNEDSATI